MASRGCVPKMWKDIANMIGRWNDANDPSANARRWFQDNSAEKVVLDGVFKKGKITHPFTGTELVLRRESLGRIGKNHRYVWLAENVTADDAIKIVSENSRATNT